jgi:methylglutaconyl-CoA hydratase
MSELCRVTIDDSIATITMNRPEKRNALSVELIDALERAVDAVASDATNGRARVAMLAGEGKTFCAGMDLQGVLDDAAAMAGMLRGLSRVMRKIRRLPIPTIARVQGGAVGGGCGLMVVPDFAFTHPEAKVGYPEVSLGVCPAVVAPWLLRKVGPGRARALLLAGGTMNGKEGFELGLASHLVELAALESAALEFARSLCEGGPHAMAVTKHWLNELDGSLEDAAFEKAAELSAKVIAGAEAQSRLRSIFAPR